MGGRGKTKDRETMRERGRVRVKLNISSLTQMGKFLSSGYRH